MRLLVETTQCNPGLSLSSFVVVFLGLMQPAIGVGAMVIRLLPLTLCCWTFSALSPFVVSQVDHEVDIFGLAMKRGDD